MTCGLMSVIWQTDLHWPPHSKLITSKFMTVETHWRQHILPSQRLLLLSPVCRIPPRVCVNLDAVWQCQFDLQCIFLVVLLKFVSKARLLLESSVWIKQEKKNHLHICDLNYVKPSVMRDYISSGYTVPSSYILTLVPWMFGSCQLAC